jgi:hypothetical protein
MDPASSIYFFSTTSNTTLWTYNASHPTQPQEVVNVFASTDGNYIAAATRWATSTYLFDKSAAAPKTPLWSTPGNITSLAFSTDAKYIASYDEYTGILTLYNHKITTENGGDPADPPGIPFGNYYIIFTVIAIISLVVILKRKSTLEGN